MAIRRGERSEGDVVAEIESVERKLVEANESSPLSEEPDYERVNEFIVDAYREAWGWSR